MATPNQKQQAKTVPGLRVVSKAEGFWRAGRAWSAQSVDVPVSDFTKAQLAQIKAEPKLVVVDIDIEVAAAAAE